MAIKLNSEVLNRLKHDGEARVYSCEWPGCTDEARHRAPRSREKSTEFCWFCQPHAAQYNKAWNFFANMTEDEVEAIIRYDTVWNRPSWPIGTGPTINAFMRGQFADPFNAFDTTDSSNSQSSSSTSDTASGRELKQALGVFGLEKLGRESDIKRRYKELVKRHHPDAQTKNEDSDERIKEINHAYSVLLEFFAH